METWVFFMGYGMGILSFIMGFCGFGIGVLIGLVIGYYLFFYFQPTDVKDPIIRPLVEQNLKSLPRLLHELPLWVKNPDYDRVDWLNSSIAAMWPYLEKAVCKTAKTIVEPIIAEQIRKYKIKSVQFETLTLGSLPPIFQGMKVYITDENELIMEPYLKWAGNPNVTVVVKSFGLKGTVQVVDLQFFAPLRITLKPLVPTFPCFPKIFVSLMDKPHVDFGLKLLGADIMAIPGLYRLVQELFQNQVANMYIWPKTLEVEILNPAMAQRSPVGILHVTVVRAIKLKKKDFLGLPNPYVKLMFTGDKVISKKTTVKYKNLNPEWNEKFYLIVKDPESQNLNINIFNWKQVWKHEKIGMSVIPVKYFTPDEPEVMILDLLNSMDVNDVQNEKFRGQIVIEVTYKPFKEEDIPKDLNDSNKVEKVPEGPPSSGGLLVVIVHAAEDVEGKHHTNPYVIILFRGKERKTKHVRRNRNPRWEEKFIFLLDESPKNDSMQLKVVSLPSGLGLLHPKEILGYVNINLIDVMNNKRINQKYHLIGSKNGKIQLELQWRIFS